MLTLQQNVLLLFWRHASISPSIVACVSARVCVKGLKTFNQRRVCGHPLLSILRMPLACLSLYSAGSSSLTSTGIRWPAAGGKQKAQF
jgi:hypothetical protein